MRVFQKEAREEVETAYRMQEEARNEECRKNKLACVLRWSGERVVRPYVNIWRYVDGILNLRHLCKDS